MSPRHPMQPPLSDGCPKDSTSMLLLKLTLIVLGSIRMGQHSDPLSGCKDPFRASAGPVDSCLDRVPNGPHADIPCTGKYGRGLRAEGGAPREVPGCGGS